MNLAGSSLPRNSLAARKEMNGQGGFADHATFKAVDQLRSSIIDKIN